jgi:DNA-damage-inducible protein D
LRDFSGWLSGRDGLSEHHDEGTQNRGQSAQQQLEVVAGSGEHGIHAIAFGSLEVIAAHPVLGLEMTDDGFDGGPALHLAANGGGKRISQTESKLKREKIRGEIVAIQAHQSVAEKIRKTIHDLGGTMPENMRVAPSIKEVERRLAKQSKPPLLKKL